MNPYSGHPGYPNGPYVPGQQSLSFPDLGGAAAGGDAAAGGHGHGHGHGGAATRRWQRHDALAPLGTPGSSSIGSISAGGASGSFGFAPSPHYGGAGGGGGGGGGGSSSPSSLGSASWLPQVQHAPHLQQQQHLQRLQQQHRQRSQQQQQQQQDDDDDGDDDDEEDEDEALQQQQQQQQQHWPHASVQKPQNPLQRSPPMRSPRWLMQHVANGRGGNGNGGGGAAPDYTVGGEGHVGGHG